MGALIVVFAPTETQVIAKSLRVAELAEKNYRVSFIRRTDPTDAWRIPVLFGSYQKSIGPLEDALAEEDGFVLNREECLPSQLMRDSNKPTEVGVAISMEFN